MYCRLNVKLIITTVALLVNISSLAISSYSISLYESAKTWGNGYSIQLKAEKKLYQKDTRFELVGCMIKPDKTENELTIKWQERVRQNDFANVLQRKSDQSSDLKEKELLLVAIRAFFTPKNSSYVFEKNLKLRN